MSLIIKGNTYSSEVTPNNELQIRPAVTSTSAGYVIPADGEGRALALDHERLDLAKECVLHFDSQSAEAGTSYTAIGPHAMIWAKTVTTWTIQQDRDDFIRLNYAFDATGSRSAMITTHQYFSVPLVDSSLVLYVTALLVNLSQINKTAELGFGYNDKTSLVDGACFRWKSDNTFLCVTSIGSSEQTTAVAAPTDNEVHDFRIELTTRRAKFYIDNILVATIDAPTTAVAVAGAQRLRMFYRVASSGSAPTLAPQLGVGPTTVTTRGFDSNRPWSVSRAGVGQHGSYFPWAGSTPWGTSHNAFNSSAVASCTLQNAGASTYGPVVGGKYQFATVAGATTDYAIFTFIPGALNPNAVHRLFITEVKIAAMNIGAAVAVTATILDWSIGINSSSNNLATTDAFNSARTVQVRRIPLGIQGFVVGDLIGTQAPDILVRFPAPLAIESGYYLIFIVQMPVGTATTSQIIRGCVTVNGWWE